MSEISDLIAWLRYQLGDIETTARMVEAGGYEPQIWEVSPSRSGRWSWIVSKSRAIGEPVEDAVREDNQPVMLVQTGRNEHLHVALHDPAHVVLDVVAKLQILDLLEQCWFIIGQYPNSSAVGEAIVRLMAAPYMLRPGYRQEWLPQS